MIVAVWTISGLLAAMYVSAGLGKVFGTRDKAIARTPYVEDFTQSSIKLIGAVEVLGAIGLILPTLTDIAPVLTPIAAAGLVLVQIGAIVVHVRRGELKVLPVNAVLLLAAAFVAVARFLGV